MCVLEELSAEMERITEKLAAAPPSEGGRASHLMQIEVEARHFDLIVLTDTLHADVSILMAAFPCEVEEARRVAAEAQAEVAVLQAYKEGAEAHLASMTETRAQAERDAGAQRRFQEAAKGALAKLQHGEAEAEAAAQASHERAQVAIQDAKDAREAKMAMAVELQSEASRRSIAEGAALEAEMRRDMAIHDAEQERAAEPC